MIAENAAKRAARQMSEFAHPTMPMTRENSGGPKPQPYAEKQIVRSRDGTFEPLVDRLVQEYHRGQVKDPESRARQRECGQQPDRKKERSRRGPDRGEEKAKRHEAAWAEPVGGPSRRELGDTYRDVEERKKRTDKRVSKTFLAHQEHGQRRYEHSVAGPVDGYADEREQRRAIPRHLPHS